MNNGFNKDDYIVPLKDRIKFRNRKIRSLYKLGYSMEQICAEMNKLGQGVSKTTVFFAIKGRSKKIVK